MIYTDKGKLVWDNEGEDLKAGDAVYLVDEEGNRNPAPDGDYITEDGKTIRVKDGIVTEIVDDKAEVAPEENPEMEALRKEVDELKAENEALRKEVTKLRATPAAKPAHQEVVTAGKTDKTGVKGLDRLSRYVDAVK